MKKHILTRTFFSFVFLIPFTVGLSGCLGGGGDDGENNQPGDGSFESGDCDGFCGTKKTDVTVDLSDTQALFTVQQDASSGSSGLVAVNGVQALTTNTSSPLFAVTPSGIRGILSALDPSGNDAISGLPRLSYVALNTCRDVFLAFEHPWIYRDEADGVSIAQYSDPWSPSSPFTCQLFRVSGRIGSSSGPEALHCVDNGVEINTWDSRTQRIQFDDSCNAYYAAHVPGNWKNLLYKYNPTTNAVSEVINSNIEFQRFLVTGTGGVLYTGCTSTGGDGGGGGCHGGDNFFRYITPAGALQQITSGWWDYTFAPIEANLENGTAANNYYKGQILFYGPNPLVATAPEWDDSCLYRFDPAATGASRSTQIADCDIDIWDYINFDSDGANNETATRRTRCEESKAMMGGGNQPDKILLADNQNGNDLNEIYIVGDVFEKEANEWKCNICSDGTISTNYCHLGSTTIRPDITTNLTDCQAALGSSAEFDTDSGCYNDQIHSSTAGSVCTATLPTNMRINNEWCEFSGNNGRSTRSAFARVEENFDGLGNNRIVRLSGNDEIVNNGWAIGNRLAYSDYNTVDGIYELREVGVTDPLITGIEVYELMRDPRDATKWFFNGLRFSDNAYVLGTFNPDATSPVGSLEVESGLTGQIDTLVIVP